MPGRESEYFRGYVKGVSAMMSPVAAGNLKSLDKTNVLQYARYIVEVERERLANEA
jgi:hypothetical protein